MEKQFDSDINVLDKVRGGRVSSLVEGANFLNMNSLIP